MKNGALWLAALVAAALFFGCVRSGLGQTTPRTVAVSFTVPNQVNRGTCAAPVLAPMAANDSVRIDIAWTGPRSGSLIRYYRSGARVDSLVLDPNPLPGEYVITARPRFEWPTTQIGCEKTIGIRVTQAAMPPAMIFDFMPR